MTTRKVKNATRFVLFLAVMTAFGQYLHAQEQDRQITIFRSGMVENMSKPERNLVTPPNKSLDASGGSVFRIKTGPARVE